MAANITTKTKKICLMATFIALGVAVGYIFLFIPNIEMITATIFIAGYLLGPINGLVIGVTAETIFSLTNPYGVPSPPLFLAQILSLGFTGLLGGVYKNKKTDSSFQSCVNFAFAGLVTTLFFALSTNAAFLLSMGFQINKFFTTMITGLHFYLIHIISNIIIFFTLVPLLINKLKKNKTLTQIIN